MCCFAKNCVLQKKVAKAIFLSVLDYGDMIYGHASAAALKALDAVYPSALGPRLTVIITASQMEKLKLVFSV